MIDTHSHLFEDEFSDDLDQCISRCKSQGVNKIVLVGFSESTNNKAMELSRKYNIFYPTAGMHPCEADDGWQKKVMILQDFLKANKVYAIGECGLDYHYGKDNIENQKKLFKAQIELAILYDLPLIVHMRDATMDTYEILSKYKGMLRGVMHCYSGSLEMANEFVKLGFYISLGGPVTFKNAKESKRVAINIPIDRLLVETDCPYLAPGIYRGKRNESSYVVYVASEIAKLREMSYEDVEKITSLNSEKLFGI